MIRLALRVRRADAEIVLAELLELAPAGVEERDIDDDVVEYAVYGSPGELPALPDLRAAAGGALVDVATTLVADDWAERWREFHAPVTVGGRVHVRAPWHPPPVDDAVLVDVVIDPAQAFGTGAHPTTRLCLALLLSLEPGGPVVDLGCGSGVLAIAAAKLGWRPVLGVDHDPLAIEATLDNARVNGVEIQARHYDLTRDGPAPGAPVVLANLLGPLLRRLAEVGFADEAPAALIAGGLLTTEADQIAAAFARRGLLERTRRTDGEWSALLFAAPR
ncbi:MAG: ribosomal protein methyltransferase [Solirubrobacteraceae bacterium]|nr:ribosomal protein methyltransferase [Solirubrobacteraceae bacterium]